MKKRNNYCGICNGECLFIGEKNRIGFDKKYCCECYSNIDKYFIRSNWCRKCSMVSLEKIKMGNLDKYFVSIDYVRELLEKNCSYSPKMVFIEITNMLQVAKKRKNLK